jgi:hypothetical protein
VTWLVFFYEKVDFNFIHLDKKKKAVFSGFFFLFFLWIYGISNFFGLYVNKECGKLISKQRVSKGLLQIHICVLCKVVHLE